MKKNIENLGVKITEELLPRNWRRLSFENIYKEFDVKDSADLLRMGPWSLELREVGLYGIFGPSGSGKTTAAGIITGFIQADGGEISMDNSTVQLFANKN